MSEIQIRKRIDGKYEQRLDGKFTAEYFEVPETGLWRVEVFLDDVAEWVSVDHESMEDAAHAAQNHVADL